MMQMMSLGVGVDSEVVFKRQNDSPDLREWALEMVLILKLKSEFMRPCPGSVPHPGPR